MKIRILSLLLCCFMVFTVLTACGATTDQGDSKEDQTAVENTSDGKTVENASTSTTQEQKSGGNKKIVIVQESKDDVRDAVQSKILDALAKAGYEDKKNAEITQIQMEGELKKSQEIADKVKELKPDVAIINSATTLYQTVGKMLDGSGIPVVVTFGIESMGVIDDSGKPKSNITGIYTMPTDLQQNAFSLLNKISPANGKKAVFLTSPGLFKKDDVVKALKDVNVELKDYVETNYLEDYQAAVKKYNDDPEVAWNLVGVFPGEKKDGTSGVQIETAKWNMANNKKPTVTYWEGAVQLGLLCGLGVDLDQVGLQTGEIAAKILSGEKVGNISAQNPRKVNIVLNQKMAKMLKVEFPADILGSASKVYDTTMLDSK